MEATLDYRIYKHYTIEEKIGKGSYGEVYKAVDKKTNKTVAIKKIIDAFQNITDAKRTYRELAYLLQLNHPCIIALHRVLTINKSVGLKSHTHSNVYAVFQFMEFDLAKTIHSLQLQGRTLEPIQRKYITLQILSSINYLHLSGLVHRDIKPSNVLINTSCEVKVCDFGLVRMLTQSEKDEKEEVFTEYVASRWYRAPEVMINGNNSCSPSIDIWSVGCILAELVLNQPLFPGKSTIDQLEKIFAVIGMPTYSQIDKIPTEQGKFLLRNFQTFSKIDAKTLLSKATDNEFDLIMKLLKFDPHKRLTVKEAIKHSYFDEIRDMVDGFRVVPTKVTDYSQNKQMKIEDYFSLVEGLSVETFRETSYNSHEKVNERSEKSEDVWFQQKSTRESNCGRIYQKQKRQIKGSEIPKQGSVITIKKQKSASLNKTRSKSKQKGKRNFNSTTKNNSYHSSKSQLRIKNRSTHSSAKLPKPTPEINYSFCSKAKQQQSQLKKKKKDKFSTLNVNKFLMEAKR